LAISNELLLGRRQLADELRRIEVAELDALEHLVRLVGRSSPGRVTPRTLGSRPHHEFSPTERSGSG